MDDTERGNPAWEAGFVLLYCHTPPAHRSDALDSCRQLSVIDDSHRISLTATNMDNSYNRVSSSPWGFRPVDQPANDTRPMPGLSPSPRDDQYSAATLLTRMPHGLTSHRITNHVKMKPFKIASSGIQPSRIGSNDGLAPNHTSTPLFLGG